MRGGLRKAGGAKGDKATASDEGATATVNERPTLPD